MNPQREEVMHQSSAESVDWLELENEPDPTVGFDMVAPSAPAGAHGIRNLMIAILEDAVRAYVTGDAQERFETEVWVASRERGFPFAFTVICETLGLDPNAVRGALRRMRSQPASSRRGAIRARRSGRRESTIRAARVRKKKLCA
jgi:hypothetical protein